MVLSKLLGTNKSQSSIMLPYKAVLFALFGVALAVPMEKRSSSWSFLGCYTDNVSGRSLAEGIPAPGGATNMTVQNCQAGCQALGFTLAGLEYADECCKCYEPLASASTNLIIRLWQYRAEWWWSGLRWKYRLQHGVFREFCRDLWRAQSPGYVPIWYCCIHHYIYYHGRVNHSYDWGCHIYRFIQLLVREY